MSWQILLYKLILFIILFFLILLLVPIEVNLIVTNEEKKLSLKIFFIKLDIDVTNFKFGK